MEPYLSFLFDHWILSSTFVVLIGLFLANEWRHRSFGIAAITAQQLVNQVNHANAAVLDTRPLDQFQRGHIIDAISLPAVELVQKVQTLQKYKTKPLILVCGNGMESPKTGKFLKENGFTHLSYLAGGMEAWQSQGMPVVKK